MPAFPDQSSSQPVESVTVSFTKTNYFVSEHSKSATLSIAPISTNDFTFWSGTVDYVTSDGTAIAPRDYEASRGPIHLFRDWQSRNRPLPITIPIHDNRAVDGSRVLTVTLTNLVNLTPDVVARIGFPSTATLTILDDDNYAGPAYGVDDEVRCSAVQPDGKIIIGGAFRSVDGYRRNSIARLNSNLTCDPNFDAGTAADGPVFAIALQSDGKLIVGGAFTNFAGIEVNHITRLLPDGTVDPAFQTGTGVTGILQGFWPVTALGIRANGKILVGGSYTNFNGLYRPGLTQLNSDGSIDSSFNAPFTPYTVNGTDLFAVNAFAFTPDGEVIVGGELSPSGTPGHGILKLKADGSLDPTFFLNTAPDGTIYALALQSDGKILAGGLSWVFRLNSDGTYDTSFNKSLAIGTTAMAFARVIVPRPDGKILVGGWDPCTYEVSSYNDITCHGLLQLNKDGTFDSKFNLGRRNRHVSTISPLPNEQFFVGGRAANTFESYGCIDRHLADGTLIPDLHFLTPVRSDNKVINLRLQGQADRAYTVDSSTDLLTWTPLFTNADRLTAGSGFIDTNANGAKTFYRVIP